ncbi:pimeloyl-ACP methyl ester carboxylesterase [Nocardiopsis sp. Huas11]|uniref:alpha/beta fold hydrolase n=1 Tax=Nocardiopsis sp. Huas11 TaxID=2183912 RepID=UPI000EB55F14|nr:alpha/beta hydrolase [Nocardiopsis sp. Huas11]RKS06541.1 pimeloyl-ACP methyl ester carboxylesterase [Nocardiopsis sp. Huas11]
MTNPSTTWRDGDEYTVPVPGGDLAVTRWAGAPAGTPVLAVHGITANGHAFARLAAELAARGGPPLLAPDLRGRGASGHLPGPHGLGVHVDDLVAVLDTAGIERTVLVGHSMGAFVACLAAVRHPDRVAGLLLVDGGQGLPAPPVAHHRPAVRSAQGRATALPSPTTTLSGRPSAAAPPSYGEPSAPASSPDTDIDAVLGPAMARLRMTFEGPDDYRGFWRRHPAFAGRWNTWVDHYVLRDLVGTPPETRSACDEEAVRVDGAQVLADPEVLAAVHRLPCPARLLWTARGLMDESPGLYTPQRLAGLPDDLVTVELPDDNHYSPLFSSTAALLAEQVHALTEQSVQVQGEL